jgi:Methyltransferase domain
MDIEAAEFQEIATGLDSRFQLWETILNTAKAEAVAEIGVWKGKFARNILERCGRITHYYMVDPWANLADWNKPFNVSTEEFKDVYEDAMRETEFAAAKRIVLKGRSKEVIDQIPAESLDFAYIDGDHTLRGITIDLIKLLPKIRDGGLLGGDDFKAQPWQQGGQYEPTLVCPFSVYFAEAMDLPIVALPFNQFLIQKKRNSKFTFIDLTGQYGDLSMIRHSFAPDLPAIKKKARRVLAKMGLRL